ncbi:hypothetical protein QMK19_39160 [Streptomyces sp. H10-C2]|uniref:hypothetical protein n=1 Tax=unclassified Streptomyces TaxID=2593676 RepID=UPI0024BABAF1|nr:MULTISPECIES: hypothetical protein [unclassified Streptomyces]MDJ0347342.1 hypothetical protein [Streptomyces sp. PH10-H1]MDJ0375455.1 hypothetical protein [Streptomyces sp. H10-C2]
MKPGGTVGQRDDSPAHSPAPTAPPLAEQTSVALLPGGGFDGPEWSVRVSLANLDYLKIGHRLRTVLNDYHAEWRASTS